jgi:acetyl esterase
MMRPAACSAPRAGSRCCRSSTDWPPDAWAAWQWVLAEASRLPGAALADAPGAGIAVGGDSAGGLLAAVICHLAARSGTPLPAGQVLIYPAISRAADARSMQLFADGFFLTRADIDYFETSLLGGVPDDPTDIRRQPLTGILSGLPPAVVVTAGFDPLRDSGEAYAAALTAARTPAELHRYEQLIHGFINMIGFSPACRAATVDIANRTAALLAATRPSLAD